MATYDTRQVSKPTEHSRNLPGALPYFDILHQVKDVIGQRPIDPNWAAMQHGVEHEL